jgi:hypothetical protein
VFISLGFEKNVQALWMTVRLRYVPGIGKFVGDFFNIPDAIGDVFMTSNYCNLRCFPFNIRGTLGGTHTRVKQTFSFRSIQMTHSLMRIMFQFKSNDKEQ